jgi:hypothetical protein
MYQDQMKNGYTNKITVEDLTFGYFKRIGLAIGEEANKLCSIHT